MRNEEKRLAMIQEKIINDFKEFSKKNENILAAILYGSFARNTAGLNSDIDLAVLINPIFKKENLIASLKNNFIKYDVLDVIYVKLRNKVVIYFKNIPKLEIAFINNLEELKRNYIGSNIPFELTKNTILFDKTNALLNQLQKFNSPTNIDIEKIIAELIPKFIYEFESCSTAHSRSDSYHFYFFYNIAFGIATQLRYLASGKTQHYYLPKGMSFDIIKNEKERQVFYELSGTTFLPKGNEKKRLLLDFFYSSLEKLNYDGFKEIKNTLEFFFERDFIWNFRDISKFNSKAKSKQIFRTSSLTAYQENDKAIDFLKANNIKTIIDLRAPREIKKNSYKTNFKKEFEYLVASFDPWNQPKWFQKLNHKGKEDYEIAYHFFIAACKNQVEVVFKTILKSEGAVAIHCHAGKDRTGLIILLINMLLELNYQEILNDYLASEMDTKKSNFEIYYNIIQEEGGIVKYLKSCNMKQEEILALKQKLIN